MQNNETNVDAWVDVIREHHAIMGRGLFIEEVWNDIIRRFLDVPAFGEQPTFEQTAKSWKSLRAAGVALMRLLKENYSALEWLSENHAKRLANLSENGLPELMRDARILFRVQ